MKILILDGDSNASRAVVQSLGKKGYTCWLGATNTRHPAFASRYVAEPILYPDPMADKAAFKAWIAGFVRTHRFDLVIPTTERTLVPLHEMRADPVLGPIAAIPPADALDRSLDKEALRALATELGVPTLRRLARGWVSHSAAQRLIFFQSPSPCSFASLNEGVDEALPSAPEVACVKPYSAATTAASFKASMTPARSRRL
jgi:hypothetical protein